jgi:hypothetical protein
MLKYALFSASLLLALLSFATDASAPSAQGLRKLYGEPTMERFAVRSGITLAVQYGPDRTACELLIAPVQSLLELQEPIPPSMSSRDVSDVLQEMIPVATRGKQINSTTIQAGGNALLKTDYENVSIERICSLQSCVSSNENQDVRTLVVFKRDACPKHAE